MTTVTCDMCGGEVGERGGYLGDRTRPFSYDLCPVCLGILEGIVTGDPSRTVEAVADNVPESMQEEA